MVYKPWQHQQEAQMEREMQTRLQAERAADIASGATGSLMCGILGLFILGIILGPIAIVFSLG